jgi:catechol 2,3-dioxygenase-like lactoylglutathione lyase family enzyme
MKLDHINIRTSDLEGVKDTLVRLLELEVGDRPPFSFPGYWLWGDGHPVVHLTVNSGDPKASTGALDHVAFRGDDYNGLISRLDHDEIVYDVRVVPGSGVRQVFFRIHHQIMIEVGFDAV